MRLALRRLVALALLSTTFACAPTDDDSLALVDPTATSLVRPDSPGNNLQFNFDRADLVESYASTDGRFVVHYTRDGDNAVPSADEDASGVPDFVEEVAAVYVEVLTFYEGTLGFRPPLGDGAIGNEGAGPGDDRFDIYLVDFGGVGDGVFGIDFCDPGNTERCAGFMTQENDYVGYGYPSTLVANRILGSHEFFHAIQAAYDTGQGSVLAEGTAVWATEMFDPSLEDFEAFLPGYFDNPDRPLDEPLPGPVDPFSYGSAIFFKFVEEKLGASAVQDIWERTENGADGDDDPRWIEVLDDVFQEHGATSFSDGFVELVTWNLRTGDFGDPELSYADGADYPRVRMEEVSAPHVDESLRVYRASSQYFAMAPGGRAAMTAALVAPDAAPDVATGLRLVLAVERGGTLESVEVDDPTAGTQTVDTSRADRLIAIVVNPDVAGDSKKPALCVGTVEEIEACRSTLDGGDGGAGGGAEGGSGAGGSGGGADGDDTSVDEGCGCELAGSATSSGRQSMTGAMAGLLAIAALARRQRRVRRRR